MIGRLQHAPQSHERRAREPAVRASAQAELPPLVLRAVALVTGALPARLDAQVELALPHAADLARGSQSAQRRMSRQELPAALQRLSPPAAYRSSDR